VCRCFSTTRAYDAANENTGECVALDSSQVTNELSSVVYTSCYDLISTESKHRQPPTAALSTSLRSTRSARRSRRCSEASSADCSSGDERDARLRCLLRRLPAMHVIDFNDHWELPPLGTN